MVDGGAVEGTVHVDFGRWVVGVWIGCEDDVPFRVDVVQFWCPEIGAVVESGLRV